MYQSRYSPGDIVTDNDRLAGSSDKMVVIQTPPKKASEWQVFSRNKSVADDNPDYPADDPVIITAFEPHLNREFPEYSGYFPIKIKTARHHNLKFYAFPESRLTKLGERSKSLVELDKLNPIPYHCRTFEYDPSDSFFDWFRSEGYYKRPPVVRRVGDRYEIIDGHRRVWASSILGLDPLPVHCVALRDHEAAMHWANRHLYKLSYSQLKIAYHRLKEDFGHLRFLPPHTLEQFTRLNTLTTC